MQASLFFMLIEKIYQILNATAVRNGEVPVEELGIKANSDTEIEITLEAADPYIVKKLSDTGFSPVSRKFVEEQHGGSHRGCDPQRHRGISHRGKRGGILRQPDLL